MAQRMTTVGGIVRSGVLDIKTCKCSFVETNGSFFGVALSEQLIA